MQPPHRTTRSARLVARASAVLAVAVAVASLGGAASAQTAPPATVGAQIAGDDLEITGTPAADAILLRLQANTPGIVEIVTGSTRFPAFRFRRADFTRIVVQAGGGDDVVRIDDGNGTFTDTELTTLDGGDGRDKLIGGGGPEVLAGGIGADTVDGNGAADVALLGPDDDTFTWSAGDGNDIVEGQGGADSAVVTGSASSEQVDVSALGSRIRLFRSIDLVTLDLADLTTLRFQALGGADTVTVNDLTATGLADLDVDLAATPGGASGDAHLDRVTVNGTAAVDTVKLSVATPPQVTVPRVDVDGLATRVHVAGSDGLGDQILVNGAGGNDTITTDTRVGSVAFVSVDGGAGTDKAVTDGTQFGESFAVTAPAGRVRVADAGGRFYESTAENTTVNGLAGSDTITAGPGVAPLTELFMDGGDGNDVLTGSDGRQFLIGGAGQDALRGGQGVDVAFMGADSDRFDWFAGDGDDIVEGQTGTDTITLVGSGANEDVDISTVGLRIQFRRSVAGSFALVDMDDVERVRFQAAGGSDFIGVGDLSGSAVTDVSLDLAAAPGGPAGDGAEDRIFASGTSGNDFIRVMGSSGHVHVSDLPAAIDITGVQFPDELLEINTSFGQDAVNTAFLAPNTIRLTVI
jgi:Ca2+-binding RTX toxin-like protein